VSDFFETICFGLVFYVERHFDETPTRSHIAINQKTSSTETSKRKRSQSK